MEINRGSFDDQRFLLQATKNADTILHIAGIHFSENIIDSAVSNNVRRVIFVHTTGIYSKYKSAGENYRNIDAYVEQKCKENGIILSILRPTMIYGSIHDNNICTFIKMVDKLPFMPIVKGARYELQPVHYKDLSIAYYNVLINEETGSKNYDLSGGEIITLRDILSTIGKALGKKVLFISFPFWFAYVGAWFIYMISFMKVDYREKVQRLCEPRVYSHEEASKDFGYNPRTFREGVIEEVTEYINN